MSLLVFPTGGMFVSDTYPGTYHVTRVHLFTGVHSHPCGKLDLCVHDVNTHAISRVWMSRGVRYGWGSHDTSVWMCITYRVLDHLGEKVYFLKNTMNTSIMQTVIFSINCTLVLLICCTITMHTECTVTLFLRYTKNAI
jgi:hypothetical protein